MWLIKNWNIVYQWETIKRPFQEAFGDSSDTEVFASNLLLLTIDKFNNSLYDYSNAISKMVESDQEAFDSEEYVTDAYEYDKEGAAATLLSINAGISAVHNRPRKSFFYMGL